MAKAETPMEMFRRLYEFGGVAGYRVVFRRELDVRRPRLERVIGRGWRNVSAEDRNTERLVEWELERRKQFPKIYRMEGRPARYAVGELGSDPVLVCPPWTRESIADLIEGSGA